jgi:hypothetical protein
MGAMPGFGVAGLSPVREAGAPLAPARRTGAAQAISLAANLPMAFQAAREEPFSAFANIITRIVCLLV